MDAAAAQQMRRQPSAGPAEGLGPPAQQVSGGGDGDDLDASTVLGAGAGLLREAWSRLDSLTETLAQASVAPPSSSIERKPSSILDLEPAEIISRLQKQLRRADANSKKAAERMALLKLCLVTACEGLNSDVQEYVADMLARPDTDVEADYALFKEKLLRKPEPSGEEIIQSGDRYAAMERALRVEREKVEFSEQARATMELRLAALEEAWAKDRERVTAEKRQAEELHRSQLESAALAHRAQIDAMMQAQDARLKAETAVWESRVRALENQLAAESQNTQARLAAEEREKNRAVFEFMSQRDAELDRLRVRVKELESTEDPERLLLELAKTQANRETLIHALQSSVKEAESKLISLQTQLNEASSMLGVAQSLVNVPENLPYLREVIVRYVQFGPDSESQRRSLIPVIATLLNFTEDERKRAEKAHMPHSILDYVSGSSSTLSPPKPTRPNGGRS